MAMQLPEEYAARMQRMLGIEYEAFLASYDRERRPSLRVNALKADGAVAAADARSGASSVNTCPIVPADTDMGVENGIGGFATASPWTLTPVPWAAGGYSYAETDRPGRHAFHEAGVYYIQEASAMSVAALSGAQPGEWILDLCAAPGGKTTQLASMMAGRGVLVSNEIGTSRARILSQNVERMGIRNCLVTNETPARLAQRFPYAFDRVIVDAPCSGEGMFRSKDEALPLWSQEHVTQCAARQQDILEEAARMVTPGGALIYSTCTFAPEEDEESVAAFLTVHTDYELVDLPEVLGERMETWGFTAGCPDWCRSTITYDAPQNMQHTDDYVSPRYGTSVQVPDEVRQRLGGTIRLFPHRMGGEGHFLAVLQRAGVRAHRSYGEAADTVGAMRVDLPEHPARGDRGGTLRGRAGRGRGETSRGGRIAQGSRTAQGNAAILLWQEFAAGNLACDLTAACAAASGSTILTFGDELYLEPAGIPLAGLRVIRPGLHLGTVSKGRFTPSQALAEALRPEDAVRTWNIADGDAGDSRDAAAYLRGESLPCDPSLKGWILVTVSDRAGARYSLGWGKASGGILKNHYPKGLRRPY